MKNYQEKVKTISKLLQERAAVFPIRDSFFDRLAVEVQAFAEDLLADTDFNIEYNNALIDNAMSLSDSPVFICGSMKSGTTLLCHLLDSHPDLMVMPADLSYLGHLSKWDKSNFKGFASFWIHKIINPTGQEPFWFFGRKEETFKTFISYLNYFFGHSNKGAIDCLIMTFYVVNALFSDKSPKRFWVEKTPENEVNAQRLSQMFPKAKFIHILRDPLNNIVSLRKLDEYRGWRGSALDHARVIKKLFGMAQKNLETLGDKRYLILKYEELIRDPSAVMHKICVFLDIQFDQVLLTPTERGKPAVSNSMFPNERVQGEISDRGKNNRYLENLTQQELRDIVTTLYTEALGAGYQWDSNDISQYKKTGASYLLHQIVEFIDNFLLKVQLGTVKKTNGNN